MAEPTTASSFVSEEARFQQQATREATQPPLRWPTGYGTAFLRQCEDARKRIPDAARVDSPRSSPRWQQTQQHHHHHLHHLQQPPSPRRPLSARPTSARPNVMSAGAALWAVRHQPGLTWYPLRDSLTGALGRQCTCADCCPVPLSCRQCRLPASRPQCSTCRQRIRRRTI